jgi:segregation and condensation protein B
VFRLGENLPAMPHEDVAAAGVSDAAEAAPASPPPLARIVEAMLFVGGEPLPAARACAAVRGLTEAGFVEAVENLNREYRREGRPYLIQAQPQGYVMALRPRFAAVRERLYGGTRVARLSPAAIDVLSLVAYRQPATKQEIDSLRGADCGALLRQLVRRGLIAVVHRGDANQREVSYGTTPRFLELFNLRSLDDLPQTQDLQRL